METSNLLTELSRYYDDFKDRSPQQQQQHEVTRSRVHDCRNLSRTAVPSTARLEDRERAYFSLLETEDDLALGGRNRNVDETSAQRTKGRWYLDASHLGKIPFPCDLSPGDSLKLEDDDKTESYPKARDLTIIGALDLGNRRRGDGRISMELTTEEITATITNEEDEANEQPRTLTASIPELKEYRRFSADKLKEQIRQE
jgi:hypothetical protein